MDKTDAIEICHIKDSYLEERWIVTQVKDQTELVDWKQRETIIYLFR